MDKSAKPPKIPCKNCICKPICRLKSYSDLMLECCLVFEVLKYMVNYGNSKDKISWELLEKLERELKPEEWYIHTKISNDKEEPDKIVIVTKRG